MVCVPVRDAVFRLDFLDTGRRDFPVLFVVVLLQVAVQVGLLPEATVAERALEGFLLVVNVTDVALEIGGYTERTIAIFARVRLLPGVRSEMPSQVCRSGKELATEFAGVTILASSDHHILTGGRVYDAASEGKLVATLDVVLEECRLRGTE